MIKKILINIRQLQSRYTGVQSYIYNLTSTLIKKYPKVSFGLATFNYDGNNEFIESLREHPNVIILNTNGGKSGLFNIFFDHFLVSNLINDHDVYFNPVNIVPVIKKKGVKYIIGVLDLCTYLVPKTTTFSLKAYYKLFLPSSLKRADNIIAISESTKNDVKNIFGISKSKIFVVHLGIDREISKTTVKKNQVEAKYFLTMATSRRKNIVNVIKSFSHFSKKYPVVHFKIVVNNPEIASEIKDLITKFEIKRDMVQIMANYISKKKLSNLYSNAIAFVYCPVYEGFGLPVLEAMSKSCPVITSTTSSLPEVAGNSALTVSPFSFQEISAAMEKVYTKKSLRKKIVKLGLINIKKFSWEKSAIKTMNIFNS